jgi:hypothetical protein
MGMVQFRAPALPLPSETYSQRYTDELLRALRIYFNQLDSLTPNQAQSYAAEAFFGGEFSGSRFDGGTLSGFGRGLEVPYALFMSDEDQDSLGITSENIVTLNRIIFSDGINVENNSRITFAYPGQYLVTARFQFANRGNAEQIFEIWAKNTGVNYPLSNTRFDIPARKASLFTRTSQPTFQVFLRLRTGSILSLPGGPTGQICTLSTTLPGHLPHGQRSHRLSSLSHLSQHYQPGLCQPFQISFHWLVQPPQWQLGLVFHRGLF